MLYGETITVHCENHKKHTDTLCGQNVEFVPHRKHFVSATIPNRLRLCWGHSQSLF
jgi:hypothetical protein